MDREHAPVLRDAVRSGAAHMRLDAERAQAGRPLVRLFRWRPPAVSLGWKQAVPDWLDAARAARRDLDVVERPTGGGLALHGSDVSCAVIAPRRPADALHQLMASVCGTAAGVCRAFGLEVTVELERRASERMTVCLSEPSPYAVAVAGRKVAGFALRRYPQAWLIQGSLLVRPIVEELCAMMPGSVRAALNERAVSLSEAAGRLIDEAEVLDAWAAQWTVRQMPVEREPALV